MPELPLLTSQTALFLDFDGTLADLAPEPDAVFVAPELVQVLLQLHQQLGGALAIVSGRRVSDIDRFLFPAVLPAAGEHGAQRRSADGTVASVTPPDLGPLMEAADALAARYPGLLVERKSAAVALHYRAAPELEALCLDAMTRAAATVPGVALLHGKCVVEAKPAGVDKGRAMGQFLAEPPFIGRAPLFFGDDVTDEAGFAAVQSLGGQGVKVGEGPTRATLRCASPQAVRDWLFASHAAMVADGTGSAA